MPLRCWLLYQHVKPLICFLLNIFLKFWSSLAHLLIQYVIVNRRDVSGSHHIEQFFSQVVATHVPFLTLIISHIKKHSLWSFLSMVVWNIQVWFFFFFSFYKGSARNLPRSCTSRLSPGLVKFVNYSSIFLPLQ